MGCALGKYNGNHENIPVLNVLGWVDIWMLGLFCLMGWYRSAVNVPNNPVHVHDFAGDGGSI